MPRTEMLDVFVSNDPADDVISIEIASKLRGSGLKVWHPSWAIDYQREFLQARSAALASSRVLVVIVSSASQGETRTTVDEDLDAFKELPEAQGKLLIPLRINASAIHHNLKNFAIIDWRTGQDQAYEHLLRLCRHLPTAEDLSSETSAHRILSGHSSPVSRVAMTSDGKKAISSSGDGAVRVWDVEHGLSLGVLRGHSAAVMGAALSDDGSIAVSGSADGTLRIWDVASKTCIGVLDDCDNSPVFGLAMTPDGKRAVSGHGDLHVRLWDLENQRLLSEFDCSDHEPRRTRGIRKLAISSDGRIALAGTPNGTVRVLDIEQSKILLVLRGHVGLVTAVSVDKTGKTALSASEDETIRLWDLASGTCTSVLAGHTGAVNGVALTPDGKRAVSGSNDLTVRVWDVEGQKCVAIFEGHTSTVTDVAITADGRLAFTSSADFTVHIWKLSASDEELAERAKQLQYTNAKVVLVGDTGVGKTGLAMRLTQDRFEPTISSDGVWATQLRIPQSSTAEMQDREVWLWDFAGQSDYRLLHQLFLDETALALLVFNPQSDNPFEVLSQWDRDLARAARRPLQKFLVAARCDRGHLVVSKTAIEDFMARHGFVTFLETSALTGIGCNELRDNIVRSIEWEDIPWTSSPKTFKILKDVILRLKDEGLILIRFSELKQHVRVQCPSEFFTEQQIRAVIGLLAGPGLLWQLEFGDFILLQPERINAYAAAVIRSVRSHTDEIGCISEERVLNGQLDFQDVRRLEEYDEKIVLVAMHQLFVARSLCVREPTETGPVLIFPSYFKRKRPELEDHPTAFVTYYFTGQLDEIYATLIVKLYHTSIFLKDQLWHFAADFRTLDQKRLGVKLSRTEHRNELTIYFELSISDDMKTAFVRYIHDHLRSYDPDLRRVRHYTCRHCDTPVLSNRAVQERISRGLTDIMCVNCENRIPLFDSLETLFSSPEIQTRSEDLEQQAADKIDNESKELILLGEMFSIVGQAGHIFRPTSNSDWGIDGEIEFKDVQGNATGIRVYLQLKSGDSYLRRLRDGTEIFTIQNSRHERYWQDHAYPVMLVIRSSQPSVRWMNITELLKRKTLESVQKSRVVFDGEAVTPLTVRRIADRMIYAARSNRTSA
jgi:small GTP-binding protein